MTITMNAGWTRPEVAPTFGPQKVDGKRSNSVRFGSEGPDSFKGIVRRGDTPQPSKGGKWIKRILITGITLWAAFMTGLTGVGQQIQDLGGPIVGTTRLFGDLASDPLGTSKDIAIKGLEAGGSGIRDTVSDGLSDLSTLGEDSHQIRLGTQNLPGTFNGADGTGNALVNTDQLKQLVAISKDPGKSGSIVSQGLAGLSDLLGTDEHDLQNVDEFKVLVHDGDQPRLAHVSVLSRKTDNGGAYLLQFKVDPNDQPPDVIQELQGKEQPTQPR